MARRPTQQADRPPSRTTDASSGPWEARLEILIAIALGLAAVVIAGAVYLNEHQEHKANEDFHSATHYLVGAAAAGLTTPRGRALEALAEKEDGSAEDHQEKAADYTLAEVILATSLFLFGIAGISSRWRIKIGALSTASVIFVFAVILLVTV
jgi:hypothetical protein